MRRGRILNVDLLLHADCLLNFLVLAQIFLYRDNRESRKEGRMEALKEGALAENPGVGSKAGVGSEN